jgi:hypothetical protein
VTLTIGASHGTPEWHDQRRGMVTASVVGRLLTVGHLGAIDYDCPGCGAEASDPCRSKVKRAGEIGAVVKTPHPERAAVAVANEDTSPLVVKPASGDDAKRLTATLVAERITGWTEPRYVSVDMWLGIENEPRAIEAYRETYAPVHSHGDESHLLIEDRWGFQIAASPDGLVGEDGMIECKWRRSKQQLQTFLADEVPTENMAQLQAQLLVSGREWCDYVSYAGGMPLYVKRVLPDPQWFEAIVEAVAAFEEAADEMVAAYLLATSGLPLTERVIEPEMSL